MGHHFLTAVVRAAAKYARDAYNRAAVELASDDLLHPLARAVNSLETALAVLQPGERRRRA